MVLLNELLGWINLNEKMRKTKLRSDFQRIFVLIIFIINYYFFYKSIIWSWKNEISFQKIRVKIKKIINENKYEFKIDKLYF